jgi:hypothetical protein
MNLLLPDLEEAQWDGSLKLPEMVRLGRLHR